MFASFVACGETSLKELPDDLSDHELPDECAALQDLCPELFGTPA